MDEKKNKQDGILCDSDLKDVSGGAPPRRQPSSDGQRTPTVVKRAGACSQFSATNPSMMDQSCENCMYYSQYTCKIKLNSAQYPGYL